MFSFLNDAMFLWFDVFQFLTMRFLADVFDKTSTSMFWTMFEKIQNIMLTMHISNFFQTIY